MALPLFAENETYNLQGGDAADKIKQALRPIVETFAESGYSMRDLLIIVVYEMETLCSSEIVKRIRADYKKDV